MATLTEDTIKDLVESIAKRECSALEDKEFCVCDYAAGNIDDAHSLGHDMGEIALARAVMELLT